MNFPRKIIFLLLALLICAGFLSWRLWFYTATVTFSAPTNFTITLWQGKEIEGEKFSCMAVSCVYQLTPGSYRVSVEAIGFVSTTETLEILWHGENNFTFDLLKIPTLTPLSSVPESWQLAEKKELAARAQFSFDTTGKLFLKKADTTNSLLAEFPPEEVANFTLFPAENHKLYILHSQKIYEVDTVERRKYKLLTAAPEETFHDLTVLQKNILLIAVATSESTTANHFILFTPTDRSAKSFAFSSTTALLCENPALAGDLFFLSLDQTTWLLQNFNITKPNAVIQNITNAAFAAPPEKIRCETPKSIVLQSGKAFSRVSF